MEIVRLSEETAYLLENLAEDVFDDAIKAESLARFLSCERHVMYLAVEEALVVGMASAFVYIHPDKKEQMFINEVGVSPTYQRQGIGRTLVTSLLEEAKERGCTFAWLGTGKDNAGGNACFSAVGGGEAPEEFVLYSWDWGGKPEKAPL